MYAVIKTGGKQYRVSPGMTLKVESLNADVGSQVVLDQVLAVGEGDAVVVGAPRVQGASVQAPMDGTTKCVFLSIAVVSITPRPKGTVRITRNSTLPISRSKQAKWHRKKAAAVREMVVTQRQNVWA